MASKTTVIFIDDIDGSDREVETVGFGLEGVLYSIDLGPHNMAKLRDGLAVFVENGRRIAGAPPAPRIKPRRTTAPAEVPKVSATNREQLAAIREWAKGEGYGVSDRGRISSLIRNAYDAAH